MKVGGVGGGAAVGGGGVRRTAGGADFAPGAAPVRGAGTTARAGAAGPVAGLEALLMLQEEGGPTERRRRAVRRGGGLLDRLEAVKLSLLEGGSPLLALEDLRRAAHSERTATEDSALDDLLDAIDTRAAVELAKAETTTPAPFDRQ